MVASTLVGVIWVMAGATDSFTLPQSQIGTNPISPSNYFVDVTTNGDSFMVTYWIA